MAPSGSRWHCELCQTEVWVRHVPKRLAMRGGCRKWMRWVQ